MQKGEKSCAHNNRFLLRMNMTEERKQLVEKNIALAHYVARKYMNSGIEYDDIVSCAYLGLVKAAKNYDFNKGYQFSTFGIKVITNEILLFFRSEKKKVPTCSLDAPVVLGEDITLKDVLPDQKNLFEIAEVMFDIKKNRSRLSEQENKVLIVKMQYPDATQIELAKIIGTSQSYASRLLKSARKKIVA